MPELVSRIDIGAGSAPATDGEDLGHPRRWAVFAVVVLGAFMAQLDLFIVNIAFPAIHADFA